MKNNLKYQLILHFIVLVWGLTGILGDFIKLPTFSDLGFELNQATVSFKIVFFRTLIAACSLFIIGLFIKQQSKLNFKQMLMLMGVGCVIGLHWFSFFYAIKVSTVSIGVVCMTLSTLFTSFLEPLIFGRGIRFSEIIISIVIIIGITIIFGFEFEYAVGITFGIISAFFASLFTVLNGRFIKSIPSFKITKFEMLGAAIFTGFCLYFFNEWQWTLFDVSKTNTFYLVILALVCTTFAFMVSVWVMKHVTPFTVSVSINMEPIYTILVALAISPMKEKMSAGFYIGGSLILLAIFVNAYLKKIARKNGSVV
ncbi:MAG: DMT family transporter [Crocinitomicaceae bacterium]